jgi:hypothetical protein
LEGWKIRVGGGGCNGIVSAGMEIMLGNTCVSGPCSPIMMGSKKLN